MLTNTVTEPTDTEERSPIRVQRSAELIAREGTYVTLETWQLRDVVDGRVRPEALILYLAVQSHGRVGQQVWPGNERLASILHVKPQAVRRNLAILVNRGWIVRVFHETASGTRRHLECRSDRPPDEPGGSPARPPRGGPVRPPELPLREPPHTSSGPEASSEIQGGGCGAPPRDISATIQDRKKKPPDFPVWVQTLASELLAIYPHGLTESGKVRKPPPAVVCRRLLPLLQPLEGDARAELASAILKAARLEREAATRDRAAKVDAIHYQKGLEPWLNQRCWESPPEFVGVGQVATGSAVVDSFNASVARAERERAAREAADPRPIRTEPIRRRPVEEIRAEAEARARKALELSRANDRDMKPDKMPTQEPNETGGAA